MKKLRWITVLWLLILPFSAHSEGASSKQVDAARRVVMDFYTNYVFKSAMPAGPYNHESRKWLSERLWALHLIEEARRTAFDEGYRYDNPARLDILKPPYGDGYFLGCLLESQKNWPEVTLIRATARKIRFLVTWWSEGPDVKRKAGMDELILIKENGAWKIDEIVLNQKDKLTAFLQRSKFQKEK